MKATPIDINGHQFFTPGTIIGKALSTLTADAGMLDAFVVLR